MKIKVELLERLMDKRIRRRLAEALDVLDQTIVDYIKKNHDNLTKAAALKVIREELELQDSEILEEVEAGA